MTADERKERLEVLARKVKLLAASIGVEIGRIGKGSNWEEPDRYLARLFLSIRLSERLTCNCRGRPHTEKCRIFRYAIQRAEAKELGVLPPPGDPL